jgi:hypothetical protein
VAATPWAIDRDCVAFLEGGDTSSELGDPPGVFMSKGEAWPEAEVLLHHVQVRMADTGATDLDDDLSWAWRRLRYFRNLGGLTDTSKSDGSHD